MSNPNYLQIKSHLQTSNVYVQRAIVVQNITDLNHRLSLQNKLELPNRLIREIYDLRKKQSSILVSIDQKIALQIVQAFPFGL